jgi:hypothetical protein
MHDPSRRRRLGAGLRCLVVPDPVSGTPLVVPCGRHRGGPAPRPSAPTGAPS